MIDAVGIIVPAKDEEASIEACVEALERSRARVASQVATLVVIVFDACSDQTRDLAERRLAQPHRLIEANYANVGKARAEAARHVLRHFAGYDQRRVWLASTDADSRVSDDWLVEQLRVANEDADALAGVVRIDDWGVYTSSEARAFRRFYAAHGSREGHAHVHGANLGVRADAYVEAGGFAALATGEDHALWSALRQRGRRIVATRDVVVATSSRVRGRAPAGFADFLARQTRLVGLQ